MPVGRGAWAGSMQQILGVGFATLARLRNITKELIGWRRTHGEPYVAGGHPRRRSSMVHGAGKSRDAGGPPPASIYATPGISSCQTKTPRAACVGAENAKGLQKEGRNGALDSRAPAIPSTSA